MGRFTRQGGIVLGAASLVGGYANSAASRPLEMTGRYVESAGVRTIEVASWLVEASSAGGLQRYAKGFELTVRVRIIHALVRRALRDDPRWDEPAWGVPICQAYLAYTLVEFCLIPLRGMAAIGAAFLPHEVAALLRPLALHRPPARHPVRRCSAPTSRSRRRWSSSTS